uniref:CCHC-type domain-containing protein n=1 Tax=Tanacetum cinerariifolium TaxID=118510 RepID=A0A6L2KEZ2_TANCI|nr:hypothetical protein [Tanacetum cinerariifolium]
MALLSAVASRFPPSNNQLKTSSNPRNQATIQDGRVTVQQVQGRQNQSYAGTGNSGIATTSKGNVAAGPPRVAKCYNCQGEGHMVRQCTQPKSPRNVAWFKDKLMLSEAHEAEAPVAQQTIPQNSAFQTNDLDAYDSDCDDLSSAKSVLMANLLSYDLKVLSEVPYSDSYPNDMINRNVQEMRYSEQTHVDYFEDNEIHSGSNIIPHSQYLQDSSVIQDTNPSTPNDLLVLSLVEQITDHVAHLDKESQTNKMVNESLTAELERYKERIAIFEQKLNVYLNKRERLIDSQIDDFIRDRNAKIAAFQQEIDTLKETLCNNNKIKEYIGKRFVTQKELSAEQAFWLKHSSLSETPVTSHTPVRFEAPSELPKVSLVNESLKKLKYQLANFDEVVKKRLTSYAITAGSWGFEHTKKCFVTEIITFLKVLEDIFIEFDKTLLDEIIEVQTIFNQIETDVDQCYVDKNVFEIQIKQLKIDNDQLLNQIMFQKIVHVVVNSMDFLDVKKSCVNNCNKCLELEIELFKKKDFIEKEAYDALVKSYLNLEKHCITLELATQLNQEIFQRENSGENLNTPTFNQLFEINELKAHSQENDAVIRKLKEKIKSLSGKDSVKNVKKDIDEIETINIELEHSVAKLLLENENLRKEREHLKLIYKDQFDSTGKTRIQSKEQCDSLIAQINAKSLKKLNLNAQLQKKNVLELNMSYSPKPSEKLVVVTPINKDKRVRFAEPVTSSNNISKQTDSLKTKYSNKPLLTSTGVKPTTSASGSKPSDNTKTNRITRPPRSNQNNKVEDHPRKVKSSLNKTNSVSKPISNALVKHSESVKNGTTVFQPVMNQRSAKAMQRLQPRIRPARYMLPILLT